MWYFGTSTGESDKEMATFGWVLLATAFLVLIMVANNSWPWVWAKISGGIPQPGQGNPIVPTPQEATGTFTIGPDFQPQGPPSGTIVPTPEQPGNLTIPPTLQVPTVNGVIQSASSNGG